MKEMKRRKKETVVIFVQHLLILTNISIAHWQRIQQQIRSCITYHLKLKHGRKLQNKKLQAKFFNLESINLDRKTEFLNEKKTKRKVTNYEKM